MITALRTILDPADRAEYTRFIVWAGLYGVLQGASVCLLIPIARALTAGDFGTAWWCIGALAAAVALCVTFHYLQAMKGFQVAMTLLHTMHRRLGDHLVTLPLGWFTGRTGSVSHIAAKGTMSVGSAAAHLMTPLIVGVTAPATVTVLMLIFDWRLGLVLLASVPLIWGGGRVATRLMARSEQATHAAAVETNDRVIEFARCQGALRLAGGTGKGRYEPLECAIEAQQRAVRASVVDSSVGLLVNQVVIQLVFTVLIIVSALLALGDSLSGVDLLAFIGVATRFVQPVTEIAEFGGVIRQRRGEIERIEAVLNTEPMRAPEVSAAMATPGMIECDRVTFEYEPGQPVLDELSFTAQPGQLTAIVGPSGAGKSTIIRLIARFYDVTGGAVRVGGADVRQLTTEDLMAQLALVFQDVYLFDDTLLANIELGRAGATHEAVVEAAELAGVTEMLERLPGGWNARVGEAGSVLSGGERQRVSIARALLKDAPIVLLDEATAALDPENERFVTRSLDKLRERSTLIVIAHKLSTIASADQILVLDDEGHIAERGTHADLLALGGRYAGFWAERNRAKGWRLKATATNGDL